MKNTTIPVITAKFCDFSSSFESICKIQLHVFRDGTLTFNLSRTAFVTEFCQSGAYIKFSIKGRHSCQHRHSFFAFPPRALRNYSSNKTALDTINKFYYKYVVQQVYSIEERHSREGHIFFLIILANASSNIFFIFEYNRFHLRDFSWKIRNLFLLSLPVNIFLWTFSSSIRKFLKQ